MGKKQQKSMKNATLLVFLALFMLFLVPFSTASYAEWVSYGTSQSQEISGGSVSSRILHNQLSDVNADFLNNEIIGLNISNFQNQTGIGNNMLIGTLGGSSFPFLITNNDTTISLYNFGGAFNYTLYSSLVMPYSSIRQPSLLGEKIAGIYKENSTRLKYLTYSFNVGTKTFTIDLNVSIDNPNPTQYNEILSSGLKCDGAECYAIISLKNSSSGVYDYYFFNGSSTIRNIYNDTGNIATPVKYPPSKIRGLSGVDYYMFFTDKHLVAFNSTFNIETTKIMSYGGGGNPQKEFITTGTFIRNSAGEFQIALGTYKTYHSTEFISCDAGFACSRLNVYNLSGTLNYAKDIGTALATPGNNNPGGIIRGFALQDYDGDNYEDVWIANGNYQPAIHIFKGSDGSQIYTNATFQVGGLGATDLIPKMTLGTLTASGVHKAFILYDASGYVNIQDPYTTLTPQVFRSLWTSYTGEGSCVPGDLNNDLLLDIACSNGKEIAVLFGQEYNITIIPQNITGGNAGFNQLMGGLENLFPDESELTMGQKILFVFLFMVVLFFIFLIPALMIKNAEMTKIMIYIASFANILAFFYFVAIGYISVGVLITMVLIALGLAYLKVVKGG